MNEYEGCIGCYIRTLHSGKLNDDIIRFCKIPPVNDKSEYCPCTICLIKGMCRISCIEFDTYEHANRFRHVEQEDEQ